MKCGAGAKHIFLSGTAGVAILLVLTLTKAQLATVVQEVPDNFAMQPPPEQPIPYSHQVHLSLGLTCEMCHGNSNASPLMGFPATDTCMVCHNEVARDRPAIQQLAQSAASGEPIAWERVYQVLPGITWAHEPHIEAGVQCGACHGDVSQQDTMAMTTSVTAMASCIGCHETHAAATACATCHAWPPE